VRRKRLRAAFPFLLLSLLCIAGCGDPGDERLERLSAARTTWVSSAPVDYAFRYRRSCFCPFVERVRVSVSSGFVTEVFDLDAALPLPEERWPEFPTIDALFAELEELVREDPFRLEVEYDPTLGYPSFVDVDIEERVVDEEFSYTVTDLAATFEGVEAR
jgi:hypothetical protein